MTLEKLGVALEAHTGRLNRAMQVPAIVFHIAHEVIRVYERAEASAARVRGEASRP